MIEELFSRAGCDGWLCVMDVDGDGQVHVGSDEPVVAASVFKVVIALEVFRQADAGELDRGIWYASAPARVPTDPPASGAAPDRDPLLPAPRPGTWPGCCG
ncbi:serine hydrolase [Nonomuraea sp. NPDC049141]|uniref:serine hydrolase n=1 Tax=unclassified Nonomuraea TaxID=2593643 RepID=UPI0033DB04CA